MVDRHGVVVPGAEHLISFDVAGGSLAGLDNDWLSVDHGRTRGYDRVAVFFSVDDGHSLPAAVEVAVWDGRAWRAVEGMRTDWATASDAPTVLTFDRLRGSRIRLTFTSRHPGEPRGAIRVSRLETPAA